MQLVETRLCAMGNRKFVPHPVGADAHIGPLESCEFAEDSRKNGAFCRAEQSPARLQTFCIKTATSGMDVAVLVYSSSNAPV